MADPRPRKPSRSFASEHTLNGTGSAALILALDRLGERWVEAAKITADAQDRHTKELKPIATFFGHVVERWDWLCGILRQHRIPITALVTMAVTAMSPAAGQIIHTLIGGK